VTREGGGEGQKVFLASMINRIHWLDMAMNDF
jgi:hypothetical protein